MVMEQNVVMEWNRMLFLECHEESCSKEEANNKYLYPTTKVLEKNIMELMTKTFQKIVEKLYCKNSY